MTAPAWASRAIWYHLYPLGFLGAETVNPLPVAADARVQHRLRGLEPWLDYAVDLGVDGLLLGPVFASESHGYDTVDYFRVDPRLGDEADLHWLFVACHQRGLRVLLDGVFNHVGRSFPRFAAVLAERDAAAHADWFRLDFAAAGSDGFAYDSFEGHRQLVALNHAAPDVLDFVTSVANYWLERGADGFRLDAAYAVPTDFWRAFAERVRAGHPDAYLVGEVIHGDYLRFVQESTLDAVTQYELWKAIWSSLNDRNFFELAHALGRHQEFCDEFPPLTFVGNHDVTRIASQLRAPRHLGQALAVLFTVPGTPAIYAGDEQGWRGVKHERAGGDAEIRGPFPRTPADLGDAGAGIYTLHQELVQVRRAHPFVAAGRIEVRHVSNQQLAYEVSGNAAETLLTALNVAGQSVLDLPWTAAGAPHLVAGRATVEVVEGRLRLTLPPQGWAVLSDERGAG